MNKKAFLLLVLIVCLGIEGMSQSLTKVTKPILPLDNKFPVVYQDNIRGGFHQVADATERGNISTDLREAGMIVWQQDTHVAYQWDGFAWRSVQLIRNWEIGADYYIGDIFLYGENLVIAKSNGTIGVGEDPTDSVNWASLSMLDKLADVNIESKADKDVLQWDNTTGKWLNRTLAQAKIAEVDNGITTNYIPKFFNADGKIQNSNIYDDGTNVTVTKNLKVGNPTIDHITANGNDLIIAGDAEVNGVLWTADIKTSSDERLKTKIKTLSSVLEKINQIRGVRYEFKDQQKYATGPQIGVIAQELQAVFPELVSVGADGYLGVNYSQLSAVLLQAIKEQQSEIEDLKMRMKEQQQQIDYIFETFGLK